MFKKYLSITMSIVLLSITLIGCSNSDDNKNTSGNSSSAGSVEQTSAGSKELEDEFGTTYEPNFTASGEAEDTYNQNMDSFEKQFVEYFENTNEADKVKGYKEPITVTTTNFYNAAMEDAMGNYSKKYGESMDEHRWIDAFKRMYNIDVTYNWQAQDADYNQKLRLDTTSGELPDVFLVRDQNDLIQMAEQGLVWDMTDIIEEYASDYDKNVWQSDDGAALTKATLDDRIYGLPSMQSATDSVSYIWFRDDWMQKLDLQYPETLDELKEVMDAFVNQDPDGNGSDDTWGVSMDNRVIQPLRGIFAAFGAYPDDWYEKDGDLIFGAVDEGSKDALEYIAELYQAGYINPEFVAQDSAKADEYILNNKVGIVFGGHWFGHTAGDLHDLDESTTWKCIPLPSKDGEDVKNLLRTTNQGWVVVNKNFEYPEIALKMRSLTTLGLQCKESAWWWYENNSGWNFSPVRCNVSAFDNLNTYINLLEVFESNDESQLRAKAVPYWDNLHGEQAWEWNLMFGPEEGTPFSVLKVDEEADNLIWNPYNGVQSSFMQERWSNITSEKERFYTDIITGKLDAETGFSQWNDTYKNLGGDDINKEVNDWYDENGKD